VLVVLALILNGVVTGVERVLMRWRTAGRGAVSGAAA